jgi:hypothetical protein
VPINPAPEPLTYETQRRVLQQLVDDLRAADQALEPVDDDKVKIVIDLNAVQLNLAGLVNPTPQEKLGSIISVLQGRPTSRAFTPRLEVAFDRGDALWLRGYCNLLSALVEFALAYDWHDSFETAAPLFYPSITPRRIPAAIEAPGSASGVPYGDADIIADLVAFVHTIHWELVEPERLKRVHAHLKAVTNFSRQSWKAILAETDDDREWIPGPQQKNIALNFQPVTQEIVDGWLSALDDFDAVLDGRKLIPHWRFNGGINFRKFLLEPRSFDLVFWATGAGAVPFIEQGDAVTRETWIRWERVFGGNFFSYAVWFN